MIDILKLLGGWLAGLFNVRVQILDPLVDMRPINLIGPASAGGEPAKPGALRFGPQQDILAVEIAVAHLPRSMRACRNNGSGSVSRCADHRPDDADIQLAAGVCLHSRAVPHASDLSYASG